MAKTTKKAPASKTKKTTAVKKATAKKETPAKKIAATKKVVAEKKEPAGKTPVASEKKATVPTTAPKTEPKAAEAKVEQKVEVTLMALYNLQQIDSQIDKIRIVRGELPLEVQDLEDEIVGLETRMNNHKQDVETIEKSIKEKQESIKNSLALIKKYEEQQMNVRNNREYDSLSKEIEFQTLEIQLAEKRINESKLAFETKTQEINLAGELLDERKKDLEIKNSELADIVTETEKEEKDLIDISEKQHGMIDDRLLIAYHRIRKNARNGLAVVKIERDACGGCFNKIPPQHQLDIMMHKKIIVCEYCGRILVDDEIANAVDASF